MDLIRSWLAAIVGYVVAMWLTSLLGGMGGDQAAYSSLIGRVVWLYLPLLVAYAIIAGAAAGAHTRPRREQTVRHLIAVLPIPVLSILLSTVMSLAGYTALSGVVLSVVFSAVGAAGGWLGADLIWNWSTRDRDAYFG
jgi:hypothetical protein